MSHRAALFLLLALASTRGARAVELSALPALDPAAAAKIDYRRDVWPILKRHCLACHSGSEPKGGLALARVEQMLKGGETGPLFTPGKPDESLLITQIVGAKPDMPKEQAPLTAAKVQTLRLWILAGAKGEPASAPPAEPKPNIPAAYQRAPAVTALAFSPDGRRVAAAYRSEVALIDVEGEAPPQRIATDCDLISDLQFSPDGTLLAIVGGWPGRFGEVRLVQTADLAQHSLRRLGSDTLFRASFAPDGRSLAVGCPDGFVRIVPVDTTQPVRELDLHSDWVLDVAYSPDGKFLISGGRDKATKITLVETGELLRTLDMATDLVGAVACDDKIAVAGSRASTLQGYEFLPALDGIKLPGIEGNEAKPMLNRDQYLRPFEGAPGEVFDLATSGDRKLLAVAAAGGEVRVYKMADRQRAATAPIPAPPIYAVALNADGSRLAVGTAAGEISLFELPAAKLIKSFVGVPVAK